MAAHILRQGKFSVEVIWCVFRLAVQVLTNSKFFVDFLANVCTFRVGSSIESRSLELEGSVRHISTDHRDRTGTDYLFAVMVPDRGDHPSRLPCSPVLLAHKQPDITDRISLILGVRVRCSRGLEMRWGMRHCRL